MPLRSSLLSWYIGVDPGMGGGLASIAAEGANGIPMPQTERDVWEWFHWWESRQRPFAVIEKVHAMPSNGVSGMFKFGMSYGSLRMALVAAGIPFEEVTPQTWQKGIGIVKRGKDESGTDWKNRLKGKAQQLFPGEKVTLATADALLIAEYCRRKHEGRL